MIGNSPQDTYSSSSSLPPSSLSSPSLSFLPSSPPSSSPRFDAAALLSPSIQLYEDDTQREDDSSRCLPTSQVIEEKEVESRESSHLASEIALDSLIRRDEGEGEEEGGERGEARASEADITLKQADVVDYMDEGIDDSSSSGSVSDSSSLSDSSGSASGSEGSGSCSGSGGECDGSCSGESAASDEDSGSSSLLPAHHSSIVRCGSSSKRVECTSFNPCNECRLSIGRKTKARTVKHDQQQHKHIEQVNTPNRFKETRIAYHPIGPSTSSSDAAAALSLSAAVTPLPAHTIKVDAKPTGKLSHMSSLLSCTLDKARLRATKKLRRLEKSLLNHADTYEFNCQQEHEHHTEEAGKGTLTINSSNRRDLSSVHSQPTRMLSTYHPVAGSTSGSDSGVTAERGIDIRANWLAATVPQDATMQITTIQPQVESKRPEFDAARVTHKRESDQSVARSFQLAKPVYIPLPQPKCLPMSDSGSSHKAPQSPPPPQVLHSPPASEFSTAALLVSHLPPRRRNHIERQIQNSASHRGAHISRVMQDIITLDDMSQNQNQRTSTVHLSTHVERHHPRLHTRRGAVVHQQQPASDQRHHFFFNSSVGPNQSSVSSSALEMKESAQTVQSHPTPALFSIEPHNSHSGIVINMIDSDED